MKRTFTIFLALFTAFSIHALAQHAPMEWNETTHDFGELMQNDKAEFEFTFKNTTDKPVTLTHVKASCGCTTPSWSKDPVEPGKEGKITVKYNTNRIGPFTKSVTVTHDGADAPQLLYIKGSVKQDPNSSGIMYNHPMGNVSFEKIVDNTGEVKSGEKKTVVFRYKNSGSQPLKFIQDKFDGDPEFSVAFNKPALNPGEEGTVTVTVDGDKMEKEGFFNKQIAIYTDEADAAAKKQLGISGSFKHVYSQAELDNSPRIEFKETSVNGGKLIEGEKFDYDFEFKNTGKSDLVIKHAKPSCGCTASKPDKEVIKPGESSNIHVSFNSAGRPGTQSKSVTIESNDLHTPNVVLKFTVEVVKDPFHSNQGAPVNN